MKLNDLSRVKWTKLDKAIQQKWSKSESIQSFQLTPFPPG